MRTSLTIDDIDPLPSRVDLPLRFWRQLDERCAKHAAGSQALALRIVGELAQKCATADRWNTPHGIGRTLTLAEIDGYEPHPRASGASATSAPMRGVYFGAHPDDIKAATDAADGWTEWSGGAWVHALPPKRHHALRAKALYIEADELIKAR